MSRYSSEYGQRLSTARLAAGLSQTELGNRIRLTRSSVANIEAGRQPQNAEQVMATALAVGCDPRWLLTGWDASTAGPPPVAAYPAKAVARHIGRLRRLADELEAIAAPQADQEPTEQPPSSAAGARLERP